ncbi:hypothetical protein CL634_03865, partial [bacterium]|nr:hypothetical protein [bacterium]
MAQEQRTFAADKIRTTEICGLDGKPVTICNLISGYTISGEGLTVSGDGHSLVTAESGIFENLTIGGGIITGGVIVSGSPLISAESGIFDHLEVGGGAITGGVMISGSPLVAAESGRFDHLTIDGIEIAATLVTRSAYAFKFGGPPVRVPERLPLTTGSFEGFTGLAAGQKYVFVEETGSFETGDHITINLGGLSGDGLPQESHTISGIDYYRPTDCCNAQTFSIGSVGGNYLEHYNEDNNGYNFQVGDTIKIDGSDTIYTVTVSNISSSSVRYIYFNPLLPVGAAAGSCICLVQPTLATESNLINDYPTGTYVSNKHPKTTTVLAETSGDFYWDNTVLLIQSNDLNNSASFIDSSQSAHLITSTGDIHHEADEFKFGISSIHLDGDGDYLSGAADNDWDFETNDFTIEFWMNSTYTEKRMHALSFGETGTTTPT